MHVLNLVSSTGTPLLQQQLPELERQGVKSTVLSVPGKYNPSGQRSISNYVHLWGTVLRHTIRNGDYDLIHANYGLLAPIALAQPSSLPVVCSLWGTDLYGNFGWAVRRAARRCDAVVVMSEKMREDLGGDCVVIPHGIDFEKFKPRPQAEEREHLGWDPDAHHVLFPYSPRREVKDYPRAERVISAVDDRVEESVYLQVVQGITHDKVARYHNASDALLLTSRYEGMPNSVKEALACNLPVVSTDVGDVARRLEGVRPSAVCDTDEELVDAMVDVLERGERSNGREQIADLRLERTVERLREVYRDVSQ
ncbi:glycosyltransferase [Halomarina litorea]|uniref:glycosyltransferase n=1 Tax=Halomarina litorea TaxID=2961595 RepID=UPI0020C270F4|nr:glycosyltransferase [Halomarina sp. BCD28]